MQLILIEVSFLEELTTEARRHEEGIKTKGNLGCFEKKGRMNIESFFNDPQAGTPPRCLRGERLSIGHGHGEEKRDRGRGRFGDWGTDPGRCSDGLSKSRPSG